ncbi:cullin-3-like [Orbicella faveolata]|uniref:cullin-3-like n=1 Tax=Orbicella faveolata TaxID=48498 RepID=UPI0009E4B224|nr:cullin-3-like [Orbicella faveolata]
MTIKSTCKMLLALGPDSRSVYEGYFEKPFLDESAEFFKLKSEILLAESSASVFLQKVETTMREEAERARHLLDPSTEEDIVKIVVEELLYKHMKTVIEMENSGVNHMLKHNKIEDLLRLFRLFKRVQGKNNDVLIDWLKMVHDCMRRYLPDEVMEMEHCEDPTTYFEEYEQVLNLIAENKGKYSID